MGSGFRASGTVEEKTQATVIVKSSGVGIAGGCMSATKPGAMA